MKDPPVFIKNQISQHIQYCLVKAVERSYKGVTVASKSMDSFVFNFVW